MLSHHDELLKAPVVRSDLGLYSLFIVQAVSGVAGHCSYVVEETMILNKKVLCMIIILYYMFLPSNRYQQA